MIGSVQSGSIFTPSLLTGAPKSNSKFIKFITGAFFSQLSFLVRVWVHISNGFTVPDENLRLKRMLLQQQVGLGTIGTSEEGKLAYHMDATVLYVTIFYSNGLLRIFRFVFFPTCFAW